jgi:predicted transcriptional regulator of viral defense system
MQMKPDGLGYIRSLLAKGRYTFTRTEAAAALQRQSSALNKVLGRLRADGWLLPLGKQFFVIVDPQNQAMGTVPPSWFIDAWAVTKGLDYYVGGLSAAEWHGAAHQRPQTFQVVVNRSMRGFQLPSIPLQLLFRKQILPEMWELKKVPTGYVHVSTPEVTAYDLLSLRTACPSLDHAATVLVELGEVMQSSRVTKLCSFGELATLQRLGWMLDRSGWGRLTNGLAKALGEKSPAWVSLMPNASSEGRRDPTWHVIENTDVQPDIELGEPA